MVFEDVVDVMDELCFEVFFFGCVKIKVCENVVVVFGYGDVVVYVLVFFC